MSDVEVIGLVVMWVSMMLLCAFIIWMNRK